MKKLAINSLAVMLLLLMITGCGPGGEEPINSIALNKDTVKINIFKTDTLFATLKFNSTEPLVWSSDNEDIATVFYGIVNAKYPGICNITVTCGDLSAICVVKVFPSGVDPNEPPINPIEGYTLVWADEFNGTELNRNVWNIEVSSNGGGNAEWQYYTDRPANVWLGTAPTGEKCLVLTAKKEMYTQSGVTRHCTSGRVNTKKNLTFTHGLIEAKINIPLTANGLWPAFWLMGNDYDQVGWPKCGEIDIMEMGNRNGIIRGTQDRYFSGWFHWGPSYNNGAYPNTGKDKTNDYSIQGSFHTFRMYWDADQIRMYLDQDIYPNIAPYCSLSIPASDADNAAGKYFHKPFFILFNLAIAGNFTGITGNYDMSRITALNEANDYTAHYYIDYVRIYQKGEANENFWQK